MRLSDEDLGLELRAIRPVPAPAFAAAMDRKVAEGFPRRAPLALRMRQPRRLLMPAAAAVTLVVVAGVAIVESDYGGGPNGGPVATQETQQGKVAPASGGAGAAAPSAQGTEDQAIHGTALGAARRAGIVGKLTPSIRPSPGPGSLAPNTGNRVVESNAQLTLAADADKVSDVADDVIRVTHQYGGIVTSSNVSHGGDSARATFQLAIPSSHLQAALGDLSSLAHVRSDNEGSIDITAPVTHARSRVAEDQARLASLRAQLAHANAIGDTTTADQLIRKIREATYELDNAKAALNQLERRARYATVELTVVSDSSGGNGWTFGDAAHDAGDVLRYAAGITVVSAAVLLPLALLAALVALVWRAWVRRSREAALGAE